MRTQPLRPIVVVIGAGDVGSAVAVVLRRAGAAVVLCDAADPPWSRRGMAFTDAWYVGNARLEEITAVFCASVRSIPSVLDGERMVAATTWSWTGAAESLHAVAIVDARMRKRAAGDELRERTTPPIPVVGIGPGFVAGGNVDIAIESAWGERLGAVVNAGPTLPFSGEPRTLGGAGRERFVYAPVSGRFTTSRRIGERVHAGELVGVLGSAAVFAPIAGMLRGLTARGARVREGNKVVEVDPRGDPTLCFGLGERPLRIATGTLAALAARGLLGDARVPVSAGIAGG